MDYVIISTVSPDFIAAINLFVPSWFRNSKATEIRIHSIDSGSWVENILNRNRIIRDVVCGNRCRIVSIDIDCFVLDSLFDGFDGKHPIAVARWPRPNMGVAFFDTTLPFDWKGFFDPLIRDMIARAEKDPKRFGDQRSWTEALLRIESQVNKLDINWNFCYEPRRWYPKLNSNIKIAHIKGSKHPHHGDWEHTKPKKKIDSIRRMFPEKVKE